MVQGIVIPCDGGGELRLEELPGLRDFQEVTGGWIEPIELQGIGATIYVNGEIQRGSGPFNSRATALQWFYGHSRNRLLLLGDVVITSSSTAERSLGMPALVHGLLVHHEFVVQFSPQEPSWFDTPLRFSSLFDAALWALLLEGTLVDGVGVRIEALDTCAEHCQSGARPW